jgi:hypothetical protein
MSNEDPISETAKAFQEVAKTTGKAIDAGEKFGGFISSYIAGSIEQGMGIFEDKLKYMRWERQVRLMQRAEQLLKKIGLSHSAYTSHSIETGNSIIRSCLPRRR